MLNLEPYTELLSKSYKDLNDAERAKVADLVAQMEAERPAGEEMEIRQSFSPGVICFQDGEYRAVSPDIDAVWPFIELTLAILLRLLPYSFRMEYLRACIDKGAVVPLAFTETGKAYPFDAGILSFERTDDGRPVIWMPVCTFNDSINLDHASKIAEIAALGVGAEQVRIWTPKACPVLPGYRLEQCWSGQTQVIDIEPIQ